MPKMTITSRKTGEEAKLCQGDSNYIPQPGTLEAKVAGEVLKLKPKYDTSLSSEAKDIDWLQQYGYNSMVIKWDGNQTIPVVIYNKPDQTGKYLTLFYALDGSCNVLNYVGSLVIDLANIKNGILPLTWKGEVSSFGSRLNIKIIQKSTNGKNYELADVEPVFFFQKDQPKTTTVKWRDDVINTKSPLRAILTYN